MIAEPTVQEFRENCGVYIGIITTGDVKIIRTHRVLRSSQLLKRRNGYKHEGEYVGYMYDLWDVDMRGDGWCVGEKTVEEFAEDMLTENIEGDLENMKKLKKHDL